jgi:hypothetical protein
MYFDFKMFSNTKSPGSGGVGIFNDLKSSKTYDSPSLFAILY